MRSEGVGVLGAAVSGARALGDVEMCFAVGTPPPLLACSRAGSSLSRLRPSAVERCPGPTASPFFGRPPRKASPNTRLLLTSTSSSRRRRSQGAGKLARRAATPTWLGTAPPAPPSAGACMCGNGSTYGGFSHRGGSGGGGGGYPGAYSSGGPYGAMAGGSAGAGPGGAYGPDGSGATPQPRDTFGVSARCAATLQRMSYFPPPQRPYIFFLEATDSQSLVTAVSRHMAGALQAGRGGAGYVAVLKGRRGLQVASELGRTSVSCFANCPVPSQRKDHAEVTGCS